MADGVAATARVITAAASVMVVVFLSFLLNDQRVVKLFGFGLAVAIAIDATLIRLVLVSRSHGHRWPTRMVGTAMADPTAPPRRAGTSCAGPIRSRARRPRRRRPQGAVTTWTCCGLNRRPCNE